MRGHWQARGSATRRTRRPSWDRRMPAGSAGGRCKQRGRKGRRRATPRARPATRIRARASSSAVLGSPHAGGLGGVTLHIAVPKGTPAINAAALSSNPHEREVILGRNTPLAVSRVVPNSRYGYDAYAVVIPPSGPSAVSLAAPSQPAPVPPARN